MCVLTDVLDPGDVNLLRDKLYETLAPKPKSLNDADLKRYYGEQKDSFDHPERVFVQQIVVNSKEEAESIRTSLVKKKIPFADKSPGECSDSKRSPQY